jgi:hypothetical protein
VRIFDWSQRDTNRTFPERHTRYFFKNDGETAFIPRCAQTRRLVVMQRQNNAAQPKFTIRSRGLMMSVEQALTR